jgi:asparagine synthetase B (glutamine-hydrolysing)
VVELSGGIDSTVAAVAAIANGVRIHGASVHFPFYEFRFEECIQQATAQALPASREVVDGTTVYSFAPAQTMAQIATDEDADRIYVGEGGDELFAEDMLAPMPLMESLPRELFSHTAWNTVAQTRQIISARPALLRRSLYTFIHDARLDVTMKEQHGVITRSPFTDLAVARCGIQWARLNRELGQPHSKRILTEALAGEMPDAVVRRRGKVNWFGVFARAYHEHADAIVATFERNQRVLHYLGIDPTWLTRRVGELSRWERARFGPDDAPIFACYGLATWLESWGIEQPADHEWTD